MPYTIRFSPETANQLRTLTARQQAVVLDAIDKQLAYEPLLETRNRRPMRPNKLAGWELRVGDLRVYYDVDEEPEGVVHVRAVGIKERNRLRIAREIIEL